MPNLTLIDFTLNQYAGTLKDFREAVEDIADADMALQFPRLVNHPAWTLGHLITGSALILMLLDEPGDHFAGFDSKKYGPGSKPVADRSQYPSREELLARFATLHEQVASAVRSKHEAYFSRPSPEYLRGFASTIGQVAFYLLATHESYHLGQIMQWKKMR
jgi:DinB superfamily